MWWGWRNYRNQQEEVGCYIKRKLYTLTDPFALTQSAMTQSPSTRLSSCTRFADRGLYSPYTHHSHYSPNQTLFPYIQKITRVFHGTPQRNILQFSFMRCKERLTDILSGFDIFKVPIGFYFRGELSYHSRLVTLISILCLALCMYLPTTITDSYPITRTPSQTPPGHTIPFSGSIRLWLGSTSGLNVSFSCVTKVEGRVVLSAPYEHNHNPVTNLHVLEGYTPCALESHADTSRHIEVTVKCNNGCSEQYTEVQSVLSVANYYVDSESNRVTASESQIPCLLGQPLLYSLPILVQAFSTYTSWFTGSFGLFPRQEESINVQEPLFSRTSPRDSILTVKLVHSQKSVSFKKEYPSGLNYGLSVLALFGLMRLVFNLLLLNRLTHNELYYERGRENTLKHQHPENIYAKSFKTQAKAYTACLLPDWVMERSSTLRLYFKQETDLMRTGRELLQLQRLLETCYALTQFEDGMEPSIRADIDDIERREIRSVIDPQDQIVVNISTLAPGDVKKIKSTNMIFFESSEFKREHKVDSQLSVYQV